MYDKILPLTPLRVVGYGKIRDPSMEIFLKNFLGGLWVPYAVKRFSIVIVRGEQCVGRCPTRSDI